MLDYIEYLNIPVKVAIILIGAFLIMQLVGEFLEFKGKVVPEFVKVRKVFARRRKEREMMQKMEKTLDKVQVTMDELNKHYNTDNIQMRDEWIKRVNSKLEQYDASMAELDRKLDKNNSDTLSILVDNRLHRLHMRLDRFHCHVEVWHAFDNLRHILNPLVVILLQDC